MTSQCSPEPDDLAAYTAAPMFAISQGKLAVLSLCTFGIYEWYWFLRQWDAERLRSGESFSPVWRALFAPCYAFGLFRRLRDFLSASGAAPRWSPFGLGLVYLLASLARVVPLSSWTPLLSAGTFVPLLFVQRAINERNEKLFPGHPRNAKYTVAEIGILLGGLALQIVGYLVMRQLGDLAGILRGM